MSVSPPPPSVSPASARTLAVAVVTPEGLVFEGPATSVVVPSHDGETAFFPQHAAYVGMLGRGELRVTAPDGTRRRWLLEGGVAEVAPVPVGAGGGSVTVLAERVQDVAAPAAAGARPPAGR